MFDRIVVPTDGSDAAWRAVFAADRLAAQCDGPLELVHVYVDADVSTHGRTGLTRLALGSVAAALVRHAPCPVVLVNPSHSQVASATGSPGART